MDERTIEVRLPDLGDVGAVKVVEWLVEVGASVEADDDLVEVETEKTTFVVPAPTRGRLARVVAEAGTPARTGDLLGELERD
jgi:pyruvate/2-oxoglutarate dehydrogenase complex dihydrolipoamide acyltransferase (E2) component